MSHRSFIPTLILIVAIFLLPAPAFPAMVQARTSPQAPAKKAWTPPKTPHGDPDLQGTWSTTTTAPLERPPQFGDRRFLTDEEVAAREKQLERQLEADSQETVSSGSRANTGPPDHWTERASRASRQTSLVVEPPDGRVPVTAAAEAKRDYDIAHVTDAFEHMSPWDRCIGRGMPGGMLPGGYGNVYQIVQGEGYVAILMEMIHEARIVPLDGRPRPNVRQWNGDSRGHWEGNTLVVETTNYNNKGWIATNAASGRIKGIPISEALRVVERFTRVDSDTIQYEMTVDDPNVYTKAWKVSFPMSKDANARVFEYACQEGNYAMTNILSGARAEEKATDEAAKKQK